MFRAALDGGHLDRVISLAREMDAPMRLEDALRVVLLLRDGDEDRYRRACLRWIARFVQEARGVTLEDLSEVVEALAMLPMDASGGMLMLQDVCVARGVA